MHRIKRAWTSSLHSISINTIQLQQSRPVSMTSKPANSSCMMGGAQMWPQDSVPRTRLGATMRLRSRLGAKRVTGNPPHHLPPCQIMDLRVIEVQHQLLHQYHQIQEIRRFQESAPWLMVLLGIWRPYEDQPASLQGQGHKRCHDIPKLALGLNSVLSCWVLGLHPPPLCYSFTARLPRGVGEKFGDGHHPGCCTHHTG